MSYLDDMAISRRPYVAFAVLGARDVTYSVAAVTTVDEYIVNVPLQGYLVALSDFDVWQVRLACAYSFHRHEFSEAMTLKSLSTLSGSEMSASSAVSQ